MKLISIAWAFLLISPSASSQTYLTFSVHQDTSSNWEKIEEPVSRSEIDRFIQDQPKEFETYKLNDPYTARNLDSLRKDLHFLDLNADGKMDVIFDGQSGGEARIIEIFTNCGTYYKNVFSDMQVIEKLNWDSGRLSKIFIDDPGCCADDLEYHKTGREWLYVEIDQEYMPIDDILWMEDKMPTKLTGWISSRYINKL